MLSGRGLCDELITCPEESYRLWRIVVCDLETSKDEAKSPLKGCEYKPTIDCDAKREKLYHFTLYLCVDVTGTDRSYSRKLLCYVCSRSW